MEDSKFQNSHRENVTSTAPIEIITPQSVETGRPNRRFQIPLLKKGSEDSQPTLQPPRSLRRSVLMGVFSMGALVSTIYGYRWWYYQSTHEQTDNAYVVSHIHPINVRVNGTVTQVLVDDNQAVVTGQPLVKLDARDYAVSLQQAQAALAAARYQASVAQANIGVVATNAQGQTTTAQGNIEAALATISTSQAAVMESQAGVPAAQAQLAQIEANLVKARLDYDLYTNLVQEGASPRQQLDTAKATYEATLAQRSALQEQVRQAQARLMQSQRNLTNAEARLAATRGNLQQANAVTRQTEVNRQQYQVALAAIAQAEAQVKNAQLQLSYTNISAPVTGRIGNRTVEVGQRVQPGQTLMSVVQTQPWIVANFKETQLKMMQSGQWVEITIDSIPHHKFYGKVDSFSPASGARFTLLPPDNATGNFTKIVQRVPVKIVFDPVGIQGYESRITPGMSVFVAVKTQ